MTFCWSVEKLLVMAAARAGLSFNAIHHKFAQLKDQMPGGGRLSFSSSRILLYNIVSFMNLEEFHFYLRPPLHCFFIHSSEQVALMLVQSCCRTKRSSKLREIVTLIIESLSFCHFVADKVR